MTKGIVRLLAVGGTVAVLAAGCGGGSGGAAVGGPGDRSRRAGFFGSEPPSTSTR